MSQTATQDTGSVLSSTTKNSYIRIVRTTLDDAFREMLCDIASGEYQNIMVITRNLQAPKKLLRLLPLFNDGVAYAEYHVGMKLMRFPNGARLDFLSPDDPHRLRGWHSDLQVLDEPATWFDGEEVRDLLIMCNRLSTCPKEIEVSP